MKLKFLILLPILFIMITGCGVEHIEGNLVDIMDGLYEGIAEEELPMMLQNTELTEENIENYIGTKDINWSEAIVSESMVGSIAHSVVLIRMSENANEKDIEEVEIRNIGENVFLIKGTTSIDEVEEMLDTEFETEDYDTIGGYLISCLGRIPAPKEKPSIQIGNILFKIERMDDKRVDLIKAFISNSDQNKTADQ